MLMKLGWNISYFDRPFIFYEKKIVLCSFKDAVAQYDFPPDFQSTFSGKSIGIDCWGGHIWYNFTIEFRLQFIFYIFVVSEKVIAMSWFSPESRLKIGSTSDFQSTSDLVIPFRLGLSHRAILVESKSDEENHIMWPHIKNVAHVTCDAAVLCGYHWCISYTQALH